jgi:hypothetical protein
MSNHPNRGDRQRSQEITAAYVTAYHASTHMSLAARAKREGRHDLVQPLLAKALLGFREAIDELKRLGRPHPMKENIRSAGLARRHGIVRLAAFLEHHPEEWEAE